MTYPDIAAGAVCAVPPERGDLRRYSSAPDRAPTDRAATVGIRPAISPVLIVVMILVVVTLAPAVVGGDPLNQQLTEAPCKSFVPLLARH